MTFVQDAPATKQVADHPWNLPTTELIDLISATVVGDPAGHDDLIKHWLFDQHQGSLASVIQHHPQIVDILKEHYLQDDLWAPLIEKNFQT